MKHLNPVAGRRMASASLALGLAIWLASPTLADSVTKRIYIDAPRWWVERQVDPNFGVLQSCKLYMRNETGQVILSQEDATKEMALIWRPELNELGELPDVYLESRYAAKAIIDGTEVLEAPSESDKVFPVLAKSEEREALLTAIADGSRMTVRFVASTSAADMTFALKGSGKAVAAYRQCLSGDNVAGKRSLSNATFQYLWAGLLKARNTRQWPGQASVPSLSIPMEHRFPYC